MGISTYKKGEKKTLSANFVSTEFDCHGKGCCSSTLVDSKLVSFLQNIRTYFNSPLTINSAYRCKTHNAAVGGASQSNHMSGMAADIVVKGVAPIDVARYAESIGVLGIGVYSTFTHIDTRAYKYFWYDGGASNVSTFGTLVPKETLKGEYSTDANAKEIWDFLLKEIQNEYGVAALMGNLLAESSLRSNNLEDYYQNRLGYTDDSYTKAVDSRTYTNFIKDLAGYGLAQWTFWTRKEALYNFANSKQVSIGDYKM